MKNELARDLSLAESKNQYDDKAKRVLSNKIILAWILKYATEEFADMSVDEIKSCFSAYLKAREERIKNLPYRWKAKQWERS